MKSRKRILLPVFCLVVVAILAGLGGLWFYTSNLDRSGWVQQNGYYYYLNEKGDPISGWMEDGGNTYYFGQSSAMVTGWQQIDGNRYYFSASGTLYTGWLEEENGQRRYLTASGIPASGWTDVDGLQRYFLEDGLLATGWQQIDGIRCYMTQEGALASGWLEQPEGSYYLSTQGTPVTGLTTLEGSTYYFFETSGLMAQGMLDLYGDRYYFGDDGKMCTGWQTIDGDTYYFDDTGIMHTGWLQEDEYSYYFLDDGTMNTNPIEIDGETCYFTPTGIYVLLVNYRNPMPSNFQRNLVYYNSWARVESVVDAHLRQMILDCRATGIECWLNCGYRTRDEQNTILNERTAEYQQKGLSYQEAYNKALETVALPGYSEHETGLAVDIVCSVEPTWLHEHCWEYGFILRYPEDKADITNIVYEHWHYRYVGTKVSMAMKDTGLCLEEYIGAA